MFSIASVKLLPLNYIYSVDIHNDCFLNAVFQMAAFLLPKLSSSLPHLETTLSSLFHSSY